MPGRKLGKKSARHDARTLLFHHYSALAPAPASCNLLRMTNLGSMLNTELGDCTVAAPGHMIQQWTSELGNQVIVSDNDILSAYEAVGGYVPGNSATDNGANMLDVLNYWRQKGIGGHSIIGYAALAHSDRNQIQDAIYYFGNAYAGLQLPKSVENANDVWTVPFYGPHFDAAPGSWGGHAIPLVAYDSDFVWCVTWGELLKMTWDFFDDYCDEVYAVLSQDWIDATKKVTPENFNLEQLQSDLKAITQ